MKFQKNELRTTLAIHSYIDQILFKMSTPVTFINHKSLSENTAKFAEFIQ